MEPWKSWLGALTIAGGLVWYYRLDSKKTRPSRQGSTSEQASIRRQEKANARRALDPTKLPEPTPETSNSKGNALLNTIPIPANANGKKRKGGRALTPQPVATPTVEIAQVDSSPFEEPESNDREWAQQLEARKRGVSLTSTTTTTQGPKLQKKRKQNMNGNLALPDQVSTSDFDAATSESSRDISVNGGDDATAAGDVSDMLETLPPGPSVIRITGAEETKRQSPQSSGAAQVVESKKQRQRRKKAEEQRQQHEEAERQRKLLLENQRRTAREARGEPARNGVTAAKPPTSNPWSSPTGGTSQPSSSVPGTNGVPSVHAPALLDIYEHDTGSTTSSNEANTSATTPATAASMIDQDLPDEETQLAILSEMSGDSGWSEVTKSKKGKKKTAQPLAPQVESGSKELPKEPVLPLKPTPSPPTTANAAALKKAPVLRYLEEEEEPLYTPHIGGHPLDSDWAVE